MREFQVLGILSGLQVFGCKIILRVPTKAGLGFLSSTLPEFQLLDSAAGALASSGAMGKRYVKNKELNVPRPPSSYALFCALVARVGCNRIPPKKIHREDHSQAALQ